MRVLVVGAGGVGAAFATIAQRRPAFEHVATDPRFNEPIFDAAFDARVTYLDMAMTRHVAHVSARPRHTARPLSLPARRFPL